VPTAIGAGKPSQKCRTGSITLHPPVPIHPPSSPAAKPTKSKIIINVLVSEGTPAAGACPFDKTTAVIITITATNKIVKLYLLTKLLKFTGSTPPNNIK
jgi:hypothetical protein